MSGSAPARRQPNVGSLLLTPQENECVFNYLGRKCSTLSTAVVQVFTADRNSSWNKKCSGVACLVKENPLRSYFIRVFDLRDGRTTYEQEVYTGFVCSSPRPYFVTFAGDTCQVGLNFSSEDEGKRFYSQLSELAGRRHRKTETKREPPNATVDVKSPNINSAHSSQVNNVLAKDKKAKGRKKLTKADISSPSNFPHVGHVEWDPNTGFDLDNLDPALKNLFDMCGISEAQLKDKVTSKAIYDLIEKKGGVEAVKDELRRQGPPPPPSNGGAPLPTPHHTSAPTPPPLGRGAPHPPPTSAPNSVDQKDQQVSSTGRYTLLNHIRQSLGLKTIDETTNSSPPSPLSRGGALPPPPPHHTSAPPTPPPPPTRAPNSVSPPPSPSRPGMAAPPTSRGNLPPPPSPAHAPVPLPPPPPPSPSSLILGPPPPGPISEANGGDTGKSALLSQIREGTQLKVDQKDQQVSSTGRNALLDQIQQRVHLTTRDDTTDSAPSTPAPSSGIVDALMEIMQKSLFILQKWDESRLTSSSTDVQRRREVMLWSDESSGPLAEAGPPAQTTPD